MIRSFLKQNFNFKNDPFGSTLLILSYLFLFLTLSTLPLFTTRQGYTTITNILSIATCLFILLYIIFRGRFYFNYFAIFTILFVLYVTIVTVIGSKHYSTLKSIFTLYALSLFIFEFIANTKTPKFALFSILIGTILFTLIFVAESVPTVLDSIKEHSSLDRLGIKYGNLNYVGRNFALGCILCTALALIKRRFYLFFLLGTLLMGGATFLTGSRGALLIMAIGILAVIYYALPKKMKWLFIIIIIAVAGAAYLLLQLPVFSNLSKTFKNAFLVIINKGGKDGSTNRRLTMMLDGFDIIGKNLIFGNGAYGFEYMSSYGTYSHNSVVELLCSAGVIGFVLFYSPIFVMIRNFSKEEGTKHKLFRSILLTVFISFLLVGLFFFVLYTDKIMVLTLASLFSYDFYVHKNEQRKFVVSFAFKNEKEKEANTAVCIDNSDLLK